MAKWPTQPSIPPGSAGTAKAGMDHSVNGCTRDVQVELWNPLRTRAIPERLRGVITTRRYTNPHLPYLTLKCNRRKGTPFRRIQFMSQSVPPLQIVTVLAECTSPLTGAQTWTYLPPSPLCTLTAPLRSCLITSLYTCTWDWHLYDKVMPDVVEQCWQMLRVIRHRSRSGRTIDHHFDEVATL